MLVHKCDKCKKVISPDGSELLAVAVGYDRYEFCSKCGQRIADMLKLTLTLDA